MKKLVIMSVALLLCAGLASAQDIKPFNIYAGGGIGFPSSPDMFKDNWKMGFHGYGGAGFNAMPMLQLIGKVEYQVFPADDAAESVGDLNSLMFGADVRLSPPAAVMPIKPFGIAGIGFASSSFSEKDESETDFYFNIGAGLEMGGAGPMKFFVMARYVSISSEGESTAFLPITAGIKF